MGWDGDREFGFNRYTAVVAYMSYIVTNTPIITITV